MKPAPFDYVAVTSAADAAASLARGGDEAKIIAGGQSLVPMLNLRLARPALLVDINGARELEYVREEAGVVSVGAVARQRAVERWAASRFPLLAAALGAVGHPPIRNRGTLVGNLVHADPASESPAVLLALDGAIVTRSARDGRTVPAAELYVAPLTTSLAPDEVVVEARLPLPPPGAGWGFAEVARRQGDFALVGALAIVALDGGGRVGDVRLAFFGAAATPVRGKEAETALKGLTPTPARLGDAARAAAAALDPQSDIHADGAYRRRVAAVLAERTLTEALGRCGKTS